MATSTPMTTSDHVALLEDCYRETCKALQEGGLVTAELIERLSSHSVGPDSVEPLLLVAREMSEDAEDLNLVRDQVFDLSRNLQEFTGIPSTRIPFGSRMTVPRLFYESFPEIYDLVKFMGCPVIFAEGYETLGLAAINPITVEIVREKIRTLISEEKKTIPFVSNTLLNYRGWISAKEIHFKASPQIEL